MYTHIFHLERSIKVFKEKKINCALNTCLFSKKFRLVNKQFHILYFGYSLDFYLYLLPYTSCMGKHPGFKLLGSRWGLLSKDACTVLLWSAEDISWVDRTEKIDSKFSRFCDSYSLSNKLCKPAFQDGSHHLCRGIPNWGNWWWWLFCFRWTVLLLKSFFVNHFLVFPVGLGIWISYCRDLYKQNKNKTEQYLF